MMRALAVCLVLMIFYLHRGQSSLCNCWNVQWRYGGQTADIDEASQKLIVDEHNLVRQQVKPVALSMKNVTWHPQLAKNVTWHPQLAKNAKQRVGECLALTGQHIGKNTEYGENWYFANNCSIYNMLPLWRSALNNWTQKGNNFQYNNLPMFNEYTQMIWANSYMIGCGIISYHLRDPPFYRTDCALVCVYQWMGNEHGNKPYPTKQNQG